MRYGIRALLASLMIAGGLFGQALSGTIVGTLTDSTGAVVAGATITLTNTGTSFTRTVETNQSGQYVANNFPTGQISFSVDKVGFQKLRRTGVVLTAADTL